ncbi:MAG: GNAT family N-acetyltransferase [Alphaproteobacteria bacterium]|nr:GNAT family N-acetyltransferase [Alphaproteobacteria bacterium]
MRTIRIATEDDLEAVLDLYAETGLDDGVRLAPDEARGQFQRFAQYPNYRLFVVAGPDGAIPASYALLMLDNIAHAGAKLAMVEQVAVSAAAQGTGLGTFMMRHAMDEARAHGCYKLALSSNVKFVRAHAFYENLGFVRHGYSFMVHLATNGGPEVFED